VPIKGDDPDATLEISPLFATSDKQLAERNLTVRKIAPGQVVYFGERGMENG